jgi:endonuclease/exonuclease/phosphatase family metal-dependent hydrolase
LRVLTLNIHKGYTALNGRFMLHELKKAICEVGADIVFLQEVQGEHRAKASREERWPELAQYEFLADQVWKEYAYGKNAAYQHGHHGNAVLSHYPILRFKQVDVSTNPVEQRGFLFCEIDVPGTGSVYGICVHLGLTAAGRRKQLRRIATFVRQEVPQAGPLIIAGDTNDWSGLPTREFAAELGLIDAYKFVSGRRARSFPAFAPMLALDRIFVRGLSVIGAEVHSGGKWSDLSDHAALVANLSVKGHGESGPRHAKHQLGTGEK